MGDGSSGFVIVYSSGNRAHNMNADVIRTLFLFGAAAAAAYGQCVELLRVCVFFTSNR